MKVRQATSADAPCLSALCMDVQSLHARHHPEFFKAPQNEDFAISFFEEMLSDPAVSIFIAEEDGEAVGYILCKLVERPDNPFTFAVRVLLVDQVSVRPPAQGQGIGMALMQRAETLAKECDVLTIQLDSWAFNTSAHTFFEHLVFLNFNFRFWRHMDGI